MQDTVDTGPYEALASDPIRRSGSYTTLVRSYYDLSTEIYRSAWGQSHHFPPFKGTESRAEAMAAVERGIADRGGFRPGMRVLEVGSGVGGPAVTIAAHSGAQVTGLDLVQHRVDYAKAHAEARDLAHLARFEVGDAADMPFEDGTFDAVYSIQAICHTPDKARVHAEVARVLKPGGVYLGNDWLMGEDLSPEQQERFVEPVCRGLALPCLSTLSGLRRDLAAAGLGVVDVHDLADEGDLEPNWREMEEFMAAVSPADTTPLLDFMERAGTALCEAARNGSFVIGAWEARKPL